MSDKDRRPFRFRKATWILLLVLGIYVLSFGPIWGFYLSQNQPPPAFIEMMYFPLSHQISEKGLFAEPLVLYLYFFEMIFGDQYRDYMKQTGRLLPRFGYKPTV